MQSNREQALELYIHIPFCVRKCNYCDFLSFRADRQAQEKYVQALCAEIKSAEDLKRGVTSVFIGGGTPSVLAPGWLEKIMGCLRQSFRILPDAEITMEANPGTLDREKLAAYRECGINRLSMGLQSAKDEELALLGRVHTFGEFLENYQMARETGFSNINVDLMFGIPGQTREDWLSTLRRVAELSPEHISAYSLIVEEGTPFAEMELDLPDEDTEYQMYEDTAEILKKYGYLQYEISNYAREGFACRHNIGYWKRSDYLGLGLGASSLIGNRRFSNTRNMEKYLKDSDSPDVIREYEPELTRNDAMAEFMFLGLRMINGVSRAEFQACFGCFLDSVYGPVIEKYKNLGLLHDAGDRISLTRRGIHVSNVIMSEFLLDEQMF